MKGMNYQDYIWDLGGTLLDNYETSTAAFVQTLKEYGLQAGHDEVYKANEAEELTHPVLFDGAADLLRRIVAKGGRNFLVSHRDNQVLEILEKTAIASAFTEVVTSANGFPRKPSSDSMLYLKDKYQISSGLVIGDRPLDIEAGQAAGFDTYLFDNMQHLEEFIDID